MAVQILDLLEDDAVVFSGGRGRAHRYYDDVTQNCWITLCSIPFVSMEHEAGSPADPFEFVDCDQVGADGWCRNCARSIRVAEAQP